MAGRNLRRQREQAINALSDEAAVDIARAVVPKLSSTQLHTLLVVGARRPLGHSEVAALGGARAAVAALVSSDPGTARLVVSVHSHEPEVERALGITRTAGQQRH